ncbi:hypothetical protein M2T70_02205 [Elizabethkingia anophelis]|uniref:hypothetical protein n=1 Tax=Elizabethkingia anophelis TaxID=1117645 RepID=UPI001117AC1E|nr:hypothetical protein [Elizabethkingia anophelis]MCL1647752.1 hypothetical protein [Elizabethkingia anophelis]MCL1683146.1 hypothetical protein [Elizabethkingia anophelis]
MIDYIKAYFPDKHEILRIMQENYTLEKINYSRFDLAKNETVLYETYKKGFQNMELKITNQGAYIHHSLHHFYNKIVYGMDGNFNDFNHSSLTSSINFLEDQIKFPTDKLHLSQGLEFGLNIRLPFDLDHFILNECILYDFCEASKVPQPHDEQVYKEFEKGNYRLKIYHKGRQQCKGDNILRVEVKFLDKRDFNKNGIYTVSDLNDRDNLIFLYDKLCNMVKFKLMCVDNIGNRQFTLYKRNKLYKYCSHKFWAELDKNKFKIESRKVYPYFDKNNLVNHKNTLLTLMDSKFTELLDT